MATAVTAGLAARLADYVGSLRYEDIPQRVIEKTKDHLANHLGLAFTGYFTRAGEQARGVARQLSGDGSGDATVIGEQRRMHPLDAAFANTTLMRADGQDDVLFPVGVHPALVTLPVALALGESLHRSGREVLTAIVLGYDLMGKLGNVVWSWAAEVPRRPIMPFGPFGSVGVAARLHALGREQTAHAIGIAANSAMGLAEGDLFPHYYGLVGRNGMMAALLAQAGTVAPATSLEGRFGFYRTFFGRVPDDIDASIATLGRDFEILNATTKRYPGTALNIVPIELMRELVTRHGLNADNVARVDVFVPRKRENFEGGHGAAPFTTRQSAVSSVLFALALLIVDGRIDVARYDEHADPRIDAVARRLHVTLEDRDKVRYARLVVTLRDGRSLTAEGDDFAFPRSERLAFLRRDGGRLFSDERLGEIDRTVSEIETLDDVSELCALLRPSSGDARPER
jgi:2-methylcitrate dehydratase PrpD